MRVELWARNVAHCTAVALALALAACGQGDDAQPAAAAAAPTVSLSASAASVPAGGSVTLTWASTHATACTASGAWSGAKPTSGSETRGNLAAASTFMLTCSGAGGSASESVSVNVGASGNPPAPPPRANGVALADDFEYDVARTATDAEQAFRARGWTDVKANNSYFRRGAGYLYTRNDPVLNSRVLVMESLPTQSSCNPWCQTDYWLKYGSESAPLGTIPANVWFQFWTYATPESRWTSQKFLYPCRASYPCTNGNFLWLLGFKEFVPTSPRDDPRDLVVAPPGGRFIHFESPFANWTLAPSYNAFKLFQNLDRTPLAPGVWYQVRIHIDTSGPQGAYELWIRQRGAQAWTKAAEWIGGVTPNFDWPIPQELRDGNRQLAMPTTVNDADSTVYLDDFVMATSAEALPAD